MQQTFFFFFSTTPETYFWWSTEGVSIENRLYHDQRLGDVLSVQLVAIVGALIRAVVEHLQELGPAQVEHELEEQERGKEGGKGEVRWGNSEYCVV